MASKYNLLNKLQTLSSKERDLWTTFTRAERESAVKMLSLVKLFKMWRVVRTTKVHIVVKLHPFFLVLAIVFAIVTPLTVDNSSSLLFLAGLGVYSVSLFLAMFTRDNFIAAHAKAAMRSESYVDKAFGIDRASLLIFNSFETNVFKGLNKEDIGSIIKLVKAGADYVNTTYGYYDHIRKGFIGFLIAFPVTGWIYYQENAPKIQQYWEAFSKLVAENLDNLFKPVPIIATLLMLIALTSVVYSLAFGDQQLERQKKRYLLWLNLVYESWA